MNNRYKKKPDFNTLHDKSSNVDSNKSVRKRRIIITTIIALLLSLVVVAIAAVTMNMDNKQNKEKNLLTEQNESKETTKQPSESKIVETDEEETVKNSEDIVIEEITKGIQEHKPKLLIKHIKFKGKPITEEMANAWLKLIDETGEKEAVANNFEIMMKQNVRQELPVFSDALMFHRETLLEIDARRGKYSLSLPENRAYLGDSYNQKLSFNLLGKQHDYELSKYDTKVVENIPLGIYKVKAKKIIKNETFNGEFEINPLKSETDVINNFDFMKIDVYLYNNYGIKEDLTLHVDDKQIKVKDPDSIEDIFIKVNDETEIYATAVKRGKTVTTNKVRVTKSMANHNRSMHVQLMF